MRRRRSGPAQPQLAKPRQDRKVATVSEYLSVPQESLVGVGYPSFLGRQESKVGARVIPPSSGIVNSSRFIVNS